MSTTNGRNTLTLDEMRRRTPAVSGIKAMQQSLQLALFGAVTHRDVEAMAAKLKEMALTGDLRAMKLFFQLVMGSSQVQAPPPIEVQQQVAVIPQGGLPGDNISDQEALVGFRSGVRASGSALEVAEKERRIPALEERAARGEPLFPSVPAGTD